MMTQVKPDAGISSVR